MRTASHNKWTTEEDSWLKAHYGEYKNNAELAKAFNTEFCLSLTADAVGQRCRIFGLKRVFVHEWTDEERDYIRANFGEYPRIDLYKMFCEHFNCKDVSFMGFRSYVNGSMGLRLEDKNKFNIQRFEDMREPIGTKRKHSGYWYIKVNDVKGKHGSHAAERENWKPLDRYIWEQHYGKIPKGYSIVYLDGDHDNCSIENLQLVDASTFRTMQRNHLFCEDARLSTTAIMTAKVISAVREL